MAVKLACRMLMMGKVEEDEVLGIFFAPQMRWMMGFGMK